MIVATAGHIDHGKTLLVRRLTGVDTDRLPEEKRRGISIDLGFAYLPTPDGRLIAFVDVPGHERFVRNMLAGVSGIDLALLVVAADDGVMPQTVEHLQILDLLRVGRGAVVVSKIDRVAPERLAEVREEIEQLVHGSALEGAPTLPVSGLTGQGLDALQAFLLSEASRASASDRGGRLRFAVDRAFTVAGSGTVVTGTVFAGSVEVGARVLLSPSGVEVRVRGIQVHGRPVQRITRGERGALNLAGNEAHDARRGDWVLAPELHAPTRRMDVKLEVLRGEKEQLRHWTGVHLHLGTAEVPARIAVRRGAAIAPGESAVVQLLLDRPIGALRGDRFIVRDAGKTRTVGGGVVIDPFPPQGRRAAAIRAAELGAYEQEDPQRALTELLAVRKAADFAQFQRAYNVDAADAKALEAALGLVHLRPDSHLVITGARRDALRSELLTALAAFHQKDPRAEGEDVGTLRRALAPDLDSEGFTQLLRGFADERRIELKGNRVRSAGHVAQVDEVPDPLWKPLLAQIEAAGYVAPSVPDLAERLKMPPAQITSVFHRKAKAGVLVKLNANRFCLKARMADLAAAAKAVAAAQPEGRFSVIQYRDATGLGRNHVIEVLEFLDTVGITRRFGDARKVVGDPVPILGAGTPPQPAKR